MGETSKVMLDRVCQLKPMQSEHQVIHLQAGVNIVGRNQKTGIRDTKCSKEQVELIVDVAAAHVKLKVLGVNPCGVNGLMALQSTECKLQHGDVLEIVYGRHPFELVFKPPPPDHNKLNGYVEQKQDVTNERSMVVKSLSVTWSPVDNVKMIACTKQDESSSIVKKSLSDRWDSVDNGKMLIFTSQDVEASTKIASYDLDGTIIRTKSGNVFPKTYDDWMLNYPEVRKKLKTLATEGFKICFFTNQGGIAKGKTDVNEFKQKIKQIVAKLEVPVEVYIAISDDFHRKPLPGMWEYLQKHKNNNIKINKDLSFFVGDAAGRPELGKGKTKRRKDHSLADRLFAHNIGLKFYTPEEHFLNCKQEDWIRLDFNPNVDFDNIPLLEPGDAKLSSDMCEMIIMVGLPGSGKSHFTRQILSPLGFTIANADTLGSTDACLKTCENSLLSSKSCVVDNTNVVVDSRKKFIDLAKKHNVKCRCFVMNSSLGQVKHNLAFRKLIDKTHSKVNEMVFNMMKKKYTPPTLEEGFSEIVKVNIKPNFERDEWKKLYSMYLVEK